MKRKAKLEFDVYIDPQDNRQTCALTFPNEVCTFYRTSRFGTHETCVFAPETYNKRSMALERKGDDKLGRLIPGDWCPFKN